MSKTTPTGQTEKQLGSQQVGTTPTEPQQNPSFVLGWHPILVERHPQQRSGGATLPPTPVLR